MSQCSNTLEIGGGVLYCLNDSGHEGDHRYQLMSGDFDASIKACKQCRRYREGFVEIERISTDLKAIHIARRMLATVSESQKQLSGEMGSRIAQGQRERKPK